MALRRKRWIYRYRHKYRLQLALRRKRWIDRHRQKHRFRLAAIIAYILRASSCPAVFLRLN